MTATTGPCRRAETALLSGGVPVPPEVASHASFCEACGPLLADCEENDRLLGELNVPLPSAELTAAVVRLSESEPPRVAAREVLALLSPGTLAPPEPSPALLRRLLALPAGHPRHDSLPAEASRFRRWGSDWRVVVALAYAACLALVAVLGVDPLSAARSGASGMTAAGGRALAEAREVAGEKLDTVLASHRKRPLTEQLDYRLYRTLAVGKAKTAAWAEILLGRVFGSRVEAEPSRTRPVREPDPSSLRSLDRAGKDAPLHRAQRA
ncbi:MAG TPA: hypothetical protein VE129_14375 [Thermoanaerobaculia bacterium]|nr:hypothetical protein [Thermoanaerobaculia bacterium]